MKKSMIIACCAFFLLVCTTILNAQEDKMKRPSPPMEARGMVDSADIVISYSSPSVKGRMIWGGLVPYGKVWRTGANEATVFESDEHLLINGMHLPSGKYALFTIPGQHEWTFIFNSDWNQWGAFKYDPAKDFLRVKVLPYSCDTFNERMKFDIMDREVSLYWENLKVGFGVQSAP